MKLRAHSIVLWSLSGLFAWMGTTTAITRAVQAAPTASASPSTARTRPVAATQLKITTRTITISPALKTALAQKAPFNQSSLNSVLRYNPANLPQLKLKGGREITLESVAAEPAIPTTGRAQSTLLATSLKKYKKYYGTLKVGAAVTANLGALISTAVDHKGNQTAIRDQGTRGTCVAHAAMAAIEAIYKKRDGVTKDLSENHAYNVFMAKEGSTCMADPGLQTWKAAGYLTTDLVCEESQSPYVNSTSNSCATIPAACQSHRTHGHLATSTFFSPEFGGTGTSIATNTNYLESLLNAGYDVVMGVYVAGSDWYDGSAESGVIDVQLGASGDPAAPYAGHAMLMVGYSQTDNYFEFKNSWGTTEGHSGYFRLTYEYLQAYAKYGYVVNTATAL